MYSSHTCFCILYAGSVQGKIDGDIDTPLPPSPRSTSAEFQLSQLEGSTIFIVSATCIILSWVENQWQRRKTMCHTFLYQSPLSLTVESSFLVLTQEVGRVLVGAFMFPCNTHVCFLYAGWVQGKIDGDPHTLLPPSPSNLYHTLFLGKPVVEKDNYVPHIPLPISTATDSQIKLSCSHTRGSRVLSIGGAFMYSCHTYVCFIYMHIYICIYIYRSSGNFRL